MKKARDNSKRTRNVQMNIRLTKEEREKIQKALTKYKGLTLTDLIIHLIDEVEF